MKTKEELRKEIRVKLESQSEAAREKKSSLIKEKLFRTQEFKKAKTIMFYVSTNFEVDTKEMINNALKNGKNVAVPYVLREEKKIVPSLIKDPENDLVKGPYGIHHPHKESYKPIPISRIDLVIVPGLAFTEEGRRLGRGAGYYDRFLKKFPEETPTIGIAFNIQVIAEIPHNGHDIAVKKLIVA